MERGGVRLVKPKSGGKSAWVAESSDNRLRCTPNPLTSLVVWAPANRESERDEASLSNSSMQTTPQEAHARSPPAASYRRERMVFTSSPT